MATKTKKKTTKPTKKATSQQTLYAYVSKETKEFIATAAKNQVGRVSKSTIVEKIFHALRENPEAYTMLGI